MIEAAVRPLVEAPGAEPEATDFPVEGHSLDVARELRAELNRRFAHRGWAAVAEVVEAPRAGFLFEVRPLGTSPRNGGVLGADPAPVKIVLSAPETSMKAVLRYLRERGWRGQRRPGEANEPLWCAPD